jgi:hypothetical protein
VSAGRASAVSANSPNATTARNDPPDRHLRDIYRLVSRQPAASASSTEQNQRVPLLIFISILAYQRLVGL